MPSVAIVFVSVPALGCVLVIVKTLATRSPSTTVSPSVNRRSGDRGAGSPRSRGRHRVRECPPARGGQRRRCLEPGPRPPSIDLLRSRDRSSGGLGVGFPRRPGRCYLLSRGAYLRRLRD